MGGIKLVHQSLVMGRGMMAVFIFLYIQVLSSKYSHYISGLVQDCGNSSGVTTVLYYAIDYCPEHFHVQHTAAKSRHINFLGKTSMSNTTGNLKLCSSRFDATGCCEIQCHLLLWDPPTNVLPGRVAVFYRFYDSNSCTNDQESWAGLTDVVVGKCKTDINLFL